MNGIYIIVAFAWGVIILKHHNNDAFYIYHNYVTVVKVVVFCRKYLLAIRVCA